MHEILHNRLIPLLINKNLQSKLSYNVLTRGPQGPNHASDYLILEWNTVMQIMIGPNKTNLVKDVKYLLPVKLL